MTDGTKRFDSFVVFAEMRTGSNFLEANLNEVPGIVSHGELFNRHFIGRKGQMAQFGLSMADREADPAGFLRAMCATSPGLPGFRFFHDHDPRVLAVVLPDKRCAKVILTRNPLDSYVSLKIAAETGQWLLKDAKHQKSARIRFDAAEFEQHLAAAQAFQVRLLNGLQVSGQTAFYIAYEDIGDVAVLNGLAAYLGRPAALDAPSRALKKQNPEAAADKVTNPEEMAAALACLDRFNLTRTPNFEPRRGAMMPSFTAAARAPLLYQPIRATGEARLLHWLAALQGGGSLQGGFNPKSLRQWKRSHPGHLSFTMVRHPLARAHTAFCDYIISDAMPEVRATLKRTYKLPLPEPDQMKTYDLARHHDAFLAFLRLLKANLAGQTSMRIDAAWATQTAVIAGFSAAAQPDLILREDRLTTGLAYIAAELGLPCPPLPDDPAKPLFTLAQIYDAEIEAAAAEALQRDYVGFGFGRWKG